MIKNLAEALSVETFECGHCEREFKAKIITWVDVSRAPQAKRALQNWQFNIIQCPYCGCRNFSGTPFFYEDFEEGLLVAVFPRIPEERGEVESGIREKYGYYPVLEFFYDMTQIWMLIYFQEHYKTNKNLPTVLRSGTGETQLRKILQFLKEDPLMIEIREKLTVSFFDETTNDDDLVETLGRAVYKLEEMLPWPLDKRCTCGGALATDFKCCNAVINIVSQEHLLSPDYVIYCPKCKEALSGSACTVCGRIYTWKLGIVDSCFDPWRRKKEDPERETETSTSKIDRSN